MSDREIMDGKNGIMCRESYGFRDPVVKHVVDKFVSRSDVGFEKYGSTLDDERRLRMKNLQGYLNDVQEELMDAVLYIQAARDDLFLWRVLRRQSLRDLAVPEGIVVATLVQLEIRRLSCQLLLPRIDLCFFVAR